MFSEILLIKFHPQITDSLFANKIFLLSCTIFRVGKRPANPGIAATVISLLNLWSISLKLFKIFILLFLNLFLTFYKS